MDLCFSVSLLAGFMSQPRKTHWQAALRILRYLKATPDLGLFYTRGGVNPEIVLQGWSDSDWAGDFGTKRSTTGYCFTPEGATIRRLFFRDDRTRIGQVILTHRGLLQGTALHSVQVLSRGVASGNLRWTYLLQRLSIERCVRPHVRRFGFGGCLGSLDVHDVSVRSYIATTRVAWR